MDHSELPWFPHKKRGQSDDDELLHGGSLPSKLGGIEMPSPYAHHFGQTGHDPAGDNALDGSINQPGFSSIAYTGHTIVCSDLGRSVPGSPNDFDVVPSRPFSMPDGSQSRARLEEMSIQCQAYNRNVNPDLNLHSTCRFCSFGSDSVVKMAQQDFPMLEWDLGGNMHPSASHPSFNQKESLPTSFGQLQPQHALTRSDDIEQHQNVVPFYSAHVQQRIYQGREAFYPPASMSSETLNLRQEQPLSHYGSIVRGSAPTINEPNPLYRLHSGVAYAERTIANVNPVIAPLPGDVQRGPRPDGNFVRKRNLKDPGNYLLNRGPIGPCIRCKKAKKGCDRSKHEGVPRQPKVNRKPKAL